MLTTIRKVLLLMLWSKILVYVYAAVPRALHFLQALNWLAQMPESFLRNWRASTVVLHCEPSKGERLQGWQQLQCKHNPHDQRLNILLHIHILLCHQAVQQKTSTVTSIRSPSLKDYYLRMEKKKAFDSPYQLFNNCQEKGCFSNAQIHFKLLGNSPFMIFLCLQQKIVCFTWFSGIQPEYRYI